MCNGEFPRKDFEEVWEHLDSLAENSLAWEMEDASKKIQPIVDIQLGNRLTKLGETEDIVARLITHQENWQLAYQKLKTAKAMEEVH